uniref:Uncharacterized protein n=1 Tax=Cacopsylla melanoneura TaxID=428564 RepID=A0A8D9BEC5_9HEMI
MLTSVDSACTIVTGRPSVRTRTAVTRASVDAAFRGTENCRVRKRAITSVSTASAKKDPRITLPMCLTTRVSASWVGPGLTATRLVCVTTTLRVFMGLASVTSVRT